MTALLRRAALALCADERPVDPALCICPAAAPAALGVVLQHIGKSLVRDRRVLRHWLTSTEAKHS